MLNNDFYLLRDEPGYRGGELSDEDEPMPLGPKGMDAVLAYLKLSPEERREVERKRDRGGR